MREQLRMQGRSEVGAAARPKGCKVPIIAECRVSIVGVVVMIWESIPQNSTWGPFGGGTGS